MLLKPSSGTGHRLLMLLFAAAILLVCHNARADFDLRMRQPQVVYKVEPNLTLGPVELMRFIRRNDIVIVPDTTTEIELLAAEFPVSTSMTDILLSGDMPQTVTWKRIAIVGSLIPVAFMWQVLLHEGSHALVATAAGSRITEFDPYPHTVHGKLYFGRIGTDGTMEGVTYTTFLLAPCIIDMLVFSATDMLLTYGAVNRKGNMGSVLYLFGMLAPMVDFAFGFVAGSDWSKVRDIGGAQMWVPICIGATIMAVGLWRIISHAQHMYWK